MSKEKLFKNELYVSSPTSISMGNCTWFAMDTKLVGKIGAMIEENKQLKEIIDKSIKYIEEEKEEFTEVELECQEYKYDYVLVYPLLEILKGEYDE